MLAAGLFAGIRPHATTAPGDVLPKKSVVAFMLPDIALASSTPQIIAPDSSSTIEALVRTTKATYGLTDDFYNTLKCESDGWQNVQSYIPHAAGPNGREDSWGVVQIHLPDHPEVTKEEALDPKWAVEWAAKQFAAGDAKIFSCYTLLQQ